MLRNKFLISYDISNNKTRNRVFNYLLPFRISGQKSCFECLLTTDEFETMCTIMPLMNNEKTDRVHIFQLDNKYPVQSNVKSSIVKNNYFILN